MSKAPSPRADALRAMREAKYAKAQKAATIFGYEPDDVFVFGEPMKAAHKRILRERAKAKAPKPK